MMQERNNNIQGQNDSGDNRILLIGPPNVGKSVIFNYMTGLGVGVANYPGTTIEYTQGSINLNGEEYEFIDVPGTYTLEATNEAEEVAVEMLSDEPEAVVCVLDGSNLESSLYLLLQVLEYDLPTLAVINKMDLAEKEGRKIDIQCLSETLDLPVLPAVAVDEEGLEKIPGLIQNVLEKSIGSNEDKKKDFNPGAAKSDDTATWARAEHLYSKAVKRKEGEEEQESWGYKLVKPWPGLPAAVLFLAVIFGLVVGVGMGLRQYLLMPVIEGFMIPLLESVVSTLLSPSFFKRVLIGEYGFLVKGLEWPFGLVLPYVFTFYIALTLLEDSGYMPRLGVLLDGIMEKIGLGGSNIIPLMLGYGCGIPGIMATRNFSTRKQRIIVSGAISLAVPCIAQTGAFIALLSEGSLLLVPAIFLFSLLIIMTAGVLLERILPGERPVTPMEIPPLLRPRVDVVFKKVFVRIKRFMVNGELPLILGIGAAALLFESGIMEIVGAALSPVVTGWLHLPEEVAVPLMLGVFRRELTVLPMLEMDLNSLQLFTGAVLGLLYVPCIAVVAVLTSEFNLKMALGVLFITTAMAFALGGAVANLGALFI
ncbi:ferrous iron transporter B [Halarsenatibacter silvermanii]|uniref:Ferrous iron transport protein B n=1 Tax=Halarsenatibacter silvermanii TaxID=321763 RepID=A0A1G9IR81_9FIRM|nr:ferrous iron transporter B [Halarsenatibacter silvermanii]SDL27374.1 ferrous iron transport protein B [Halarsenatibacter silvermanii]